MEFVPFLPVFVLAVLLIGFAIVQRRERAR
jgi:hypothetical protein